jgi:hypothetical protein
MTPNSVLYQVPMSRLRPIELQTPEQLHALFRQLHVLHQEVSDDLELDMSFVSFLRPNGILAIVSTARLWHRWTQRQLVLTNIRSDVHKYLERIDMFTVCANWLKTPQTLPEENRFARSSASRTLLEILPIAGSSPQLSADIHRTYERTNTILRCWFPNRTDLLERLCKMIVEIAENIGHSQDQGFALVQRYDGSIRPQLGSEIVIAVVDLGIGIEQSLTLRGVQPPIEAGQVVQGSDYICHALRQGVSSRAEAAGLGLWRVQQIVDDWRGELVIRSAASQVRFANGSYITEDDLPLLPGTQVTITVRDP